MSAEEDDKPPLPRGTVSMGPPGSAEHDRIEETCRKCGRPILVEPWIVECRKCQDPNTTRGRAYPKEPKHYLGRAGTPKKTS